MSLFSLPPVVAAAAAAAESLAAGYQFLRAVVLAVVGWIRPLHFSASSRADYCTSSSTVVWCVHRICGWDASAAVGRIRYVWWRRTESHRDRQVQKRGNDQSTGRRASGVVWLCCAVLCCAVLCCAAGTGSWRWVKAKSGIVRYLPVTRRCSNAYLYVYRTPRTNHTEVQEQFILIYGAHDQITSGEMSQINRDIDSGLGKAVQSPRWRWAHNAHDISQPTPPQFALTHLR